MRACARAMGRSLNKSLGLSPRSRPRAYLVSAVAAASRPASSWREWMLTLANTLPRWYSIALVDRYSSSATSRLDLPDATSRATTSSRGGQAVAILPLRVPGADAAGGQLGLASDEERVRAELAEPITRHGRVAIASRRLPCLRRNCP